MRKEKIHKAFMLLWSGEIDAPSATRDLTEPERNALMEVVVAALRGCMRRLSGENLERLESRADNLVASMPEVL